jgi:hypothetical protein
MRGPARRNNHSLQISPCQHGPIVGVTIGALPLRLLQAVYLPIDAILIHIAHRRDVHILHVRY